LCIRKAAKAYPSSHPAADVLLTMGDFVGWGFEARRTAALVALSISMGSAASVAQEAAPAAAEPAPVELPKLTVETKAQAKSKQKQKAVQKAPASAPAPVQALQPQPPTGDSSGTESATGPVNGIVATRSATGTKTDTPLMETPQSVSVISAERMEQQGATSVTQALAYTAGVGGALYGVDTRFDWLSIRGFDAYQPGFFVDGMLVRNNNSWSVWKVEPYGTERIEVLKGPPSVLYGQGNAGGMVNVVTKRPLDEPLAETELRFGSHGRAEGLFDFSGPATQDGKVLYRLTGVLLDTDTQVDFTDQQRAFIAPAITWRPNNDTSLTLLGQYLKEDDVPNIGFLPPEGTLLPNENGKIRRGFFSGELGYDKFKQEQWSAGYILEHRFNEVWQARQSFRYNGTDIDYAQVFGAGLLAPDELDRYAFASVESQTTFVTDNQVQADFVAGGVKHKVLAGLDYQHNTFNQRSAFGGSYPINPFDPVYGQDTIVTDPPYFDGETTLEQTGIYLQEQAKIAERLIVTLGGRYDWANTKVVARVGDDAEKSDQAFTWKGGVLYRDPSGFAPYYSYSESFFPISTINPDTGAPFDPETGQQHEVGIKYEISGVKSLFTLAGFDIKRQNYVTFDNTAFAPHAAGEIHSQGIEFEGSAELASGLDIIAAYTWLPTFEITESADPIEVGQRQPITPEHTASLWLHYTLQDGPLKGFGFGGGVRYIGETFGDIENSKLMTVPDYTLFDGVVDYEFDNWRFAVNVSNIGDETTLTCWDTCYYGAGREVLASIKRRW
jgi:iron complex outermembrane receptor protein